MSAIVTSVEIARSPEAVFAYIDDLVRHAEWQERLVRVTVETEGPTRVGTRVTHQRRVGPRTLTTTSEITVHDPPHLISFRGVDGPIRAVGSQRIEPAGEGSRVTLELELDAHGLGKLMLPMVRKQASGQVVTDHERLKEILESAAA
ncbi:MAG: SRPBCC family protein [Gaiellaceae bacterium]